MTNLLYARYTASITEFKANPMVVANSGFGEPIAILNRNQVAFYCVPNAWMERFVDLIEDVQLNELAQEALSEPTVKVDIKSLEQDVIRKVSKK